MTEREQRRIEVCPGCKELLLDVRARNSFAVLYADLLAAHAIENHKCDGHGETTKGGGNVADN